MSQTSVINLWSGEPPHQVQRLGSEKTFTMMASMGEGTKMVRNISVPAMTIYSPEPGNQNGVGVIVIPGGGMHMLAWEHEGSNIGQWLVQKGFTAMIIKHRVAATPDDDSVFEGMLQQMTAKATERIPAAKARRRIDEVPMSEGVKQAHPAAMADVRRSVAIARAKAHELGLDRSKIGILGFSAGADLAIRTTLDPEVPSPAFVAACYGGDTHDQPIPVDAPPLFVAAAQDDINCFQVAMNLFKDWSLADRPAELHLFERGGHGFSLADGEACGAWTDLFLSWLSLNGIVDVADRK